MVLLRGFLKLLKVNRSGEIVPSAMQGLYGKSSKIRPSGLYENDSEARRIKSDVDSKNLRRDIKTRSDFEGRNNKDILSRTNRVGVGGRTVTSVPAVPELDSRSVYELEGKSVDRKEHRYIPYRPKPVDGNSVGREEHRYIPYRPKPVELDGNDKIKKKEFNPWSPLSYNALNSHNRNYVNNHNASHDNNRNSEIHWDEENYSRYYKGIPKEECKPRKRFSHSTKLGEIYSVKDSEINRYISRHSGNQDYIKHKHVYVNKSKKGKIMDKITDIVFK